MYLKIKGYVPVIILGVLAALIAGAMISKWKYEDSREQEAWDVLRESDQGVAARAHLAVPLVARYDKLMKEHPEGGPEADRIARKLLNMFPEFADPTAAKEGKVRLIPVPRMQELLEHYIRLG